jgi:hypothetical protein
VIRDFTAPLAWAARATAAMSTLPGKSEDDNKVVAAKCEIKRVEFPAHFLGQLLDHGLAFRTAFLNEPLQTVLSVGALTEIFWHLILLFGLIIWPGSNDHNSNGSQDFAGVDLARPGEAEDEKQSERKCGSYSI